MEMGWFVAQQVLNGLVLGAAYILLAVGFTLTFGVLKLINAAQGHFYMLGAFLVFQVMSWTVGTVNAGVVPYLISIVLSMLGVGLVGVAVHVLGIKPIWGRGQVAPIITTIALAFLIENISLLLWPGSLYSIQTTLGSTTRTIGLLRITDQRIMTFIAAFVIVAGLAYFLQNTRTGKAMRATTQNELSAAFVGINPEAMRMLAMVLSAGLAAAGGGLIGPLFPLTVSMAQPSLFKAMVVVLVGGLGNVPGAIAGGLFLGLTESLIGGLGDAAWVNVAIFATILVVLILRPTGLLGTKGSLA